MESISEKARAVVNSSSKETIIIQNIIIAFIITSLMGISFLLYNLYRSINTPIKDLNSMAEGFGGGDLSIILNESNRDEFGILASHFNNATLNSSKMISSSPDPLYNKLYSEAAKN